MRLFEIRKESGEIIETAEGFNDKKRARLFRNFMRQAFPEEKFFITKGEDHHRRIKKIPTGPMNVSTRRKRRHPDTPL